MQKKVDIQAVLKQSLHTESVVDDLCTYEPIWPPRWHKQQASCCEAEQDAVWVKTRMY